MSEEEEEDKKPKIGAADITSDDTADKNAKKRKTADASSTVPESDDKSKKGASIWFTFKKGVESATKDDEARREYIVDCGMLP